jgi:hypothetical protein
MFSVMISIVVLVIAGALIFRLLFKDSITRQKRNIEETDHPETKADLIKKTNTANDIIAFSSLDLQLHSMIMSRRALRLTHYI